jgi:type I restriction enzyme S subunit
MSKWREVRFKDAIEFNPKVKLDKNRHYPCIGIANIDESSLSVYENESLKYTGQSSSKFKSGDVLFSRITPCLENRKIARVFLESSDRGFGSTELFVFRGKKGKTLTKFVSYLAQTDIIVLPAINSMSGASGRQRADRYFIEKLKIKIPDLETQKKIADVLSTYDELIENNNRRIEILEKTAEVIYKEWFVRMRFPGYENIKFNKGIPGGWEVKRVGDVAKVKSGFAFKSEWWQDNGIPVIKIKDIQNNTVNLTGLFYVSKENADKAKQFYVSAGDLLIAMTGATIGKTALVPYCNLMTVNQRVGKFFLGDNPQNKVAFLFCLFLQSHIQEQIITIGSSNAAQPNISPFDIEKIKIVYNESVINEFNQKVQPCISLILKLQQQNQNLIKQRDLLLPRLMNGTIEIR